MENRLAKCGKASVRNIVEYNDLVRQRKVEDEIMPYIVVIIDEFADLIMTAKEVEQPVMRLAQKARAIGIHLIVATQRPDVKVITGGKQRAERRGRWGRCKRMPKRYLPLPGTLPFCPQRTFRAYS